MASPGEEDKCEDWCFGCKDGGTLMICEYPDCPKVYHPDCVRKENSTKESEGNLICRWHICYLCDKASHLFCLCCPNAVCRGCVIAADFTLIKENKGLCNECLVYVLELEEIREHAPNGLIDLKDRNTVECLFLEYWDLIKDHESLTIEDVYSAKFQKKGIKRRYKKDPNFQPSCIEINDDEDCKSKGSQRIMKFIGWGSEPLIKFLRSIGKDTDEKMSQFDVESIILQYIREKKLLYHGKKKAYCDGKLCPIFKKKSVRINRIYSLLEKHLNEEDFELSEKGVIDLERDCCFKEKSENVLVSSKKHKTDKSDEKTYEEEVKPKFWSTASVAINSDNMKHVYLRKSLVEELLKQNEGFGNKVVGSFVKLKNDPKDPMQRNLYQIMQVTGIDWIPTADDQNRGVVLHVSGQSVCISKLSDSDITEEEIEDLKQKMMSGLMRKPTVVEMEQKAKVLHEDITKHWIARQLVILTNRINNANEKGRRLELDEYLEQREMLERPVEQEKLLKQIPKIIEDIVEVKREDSSREEIEVIDVW